MITLGERRAVPSVKPLRLRHRFKGGIDRGGGFVSLGSGSMPMVFDRLGVGKGTVGVGVSSSD
jgi:hypothetical protein